MDNNRVSSNLPKPWNSKELVGEHSTPRRRRTVRYSGARVCGSCLSDMSVILKYGGKHVVNFGSGQGFDKPGGAHQPNERINCDVLLDYTKAIASYILRTLG